MSSPEARRSGALSERWKNFLELNAREFLSVEFKDVSLADLISDVDVRGHLKTAEGAIGTGRYRDALESVSRGFRVLTRGAPARLPQRLRYRTELNDALVDANDVPSIQDYNAQGRVQRLVREMNQRYERLVQVVEALRLGLNAGDYDRFRYLTPLVAFGGQPMWSNHSSLHDTKENATFCLHFVIDAAMRLLQSPVLRDPANRFTVEVEADSVPLLTFAGEGQPLVEKGRALKGQRFERLELTYVLAPGAGEHWKIGAWSEERKWEDVSFLPLSGVKIVEEHRDKAS